MEGADKLSESQRSERWESISKVINDKTDLKAQKDNRAKIRTEVEKRQKYRQIHNLNRK